MICKNCGKEVSDNNKFCSFCGMNLSRGNAAEDDIRDSTGSFATETENENGTEMARGINKKIVFGIICLAVVVVVAAGVLIVKGGILNKNPLLGVYEDESGFSTFCFAKDESFYLTVVNDKKIVGEYQVDTKNLELTLVVDGYAKRYKYDINEDQLILGEINGEDSDISIVLVKTDEAPDSSLDTNPNPSKLIGAYSRPWCGPIYFRDDGIFLDASDKTTLMEGTYKIDGNRLTIITDETETYQYEFLGEDLVLYEISDEVSSTGRIHTREEMDEEDVRDSLTRRWSTYFSDRLYGEEDTENESTDENSENDYDYDYDYDYDSDDLSDEELELVGYWTDDDGNYAQFIGDRMCYLSAYEREYSFNYFECDTDGTITAYTDDNDIVLFEYDIYLDNESHYILDLSFNDPLEGKYIDLHLMRTNLNGKVTKD